VNPIIRRQEKKKRREEKTGLVEGIQAPSGRDPNPKWKGSQPIVAWIPF
jgi:hypothetical protein